MSAVQRGPSVIDPPVTSCFADLPRLRMHYVTAGPDNGRPVLLLHGFPEFWYSWRYQIDALAARGYRIYAPDQRGYNLTGKHGPYDIPVLVEDIRQFQIALGLERCHIGGHDWGAIIAYSFAAAHPQHVEKLVITNGPHPNGYLIARRLNKKQLTASWYIYFFQLPFLPERFLAKNNFEVITSIFRWLKNHPLCDEEIRRYQEAFAQPGSLSAMVGWYRALARQALRGKFALKQPNIAAPTCVIWGERDRALVKECNDPLPRYIPNLEIHYLPKATHWALIDHAEEVNQLLLDFLDRPTP